MRVYLDSLGCRLNAAETEAIAREFAGAGHQVVASPRGSDLIVVNSCAVTAQASRRSRQLVRALHRESPSADIAVLGCWATEDAAEARRLSGVRWVVSNADKAGVVAEILGERAVALPWTPGTWGHTRAFLGVQDGCDSACTYCVTRILRGSARSRPLEDVVRAVIELVERGAQEVVLTGVSLGAYGRDLAMADGLATLVQAILQNTAVPRLRLSSVEPWDVTPALLEQWQDGRLCRQLHLPLQSGSDSVLKRMGRRTSVKEYLALVEVARSVQPEMGITTDLIVGFPGEADEDFDETLHVVTKVRFSRLHVFRYSQRPGTAAIRLPDQVPTAVRKARARRLRELGKKLAAEYRSQFVGKVLPVLWEQRAGDSSPWRGLTDNYLYVEMRDPAARYNTITPTRMVACTGDVLIGEVVDG